jgi:O-antigen/teichoic acid export membrane protein
MRPPPPVADGSRAEGDARHAARSGLIQVLTIILQAVTSATQVVFARLFGPVVYGAYQAAYAVVELAIRGAPAGGDKGMLRYVAAARAAGDPEGVRRALGTGLRLGLLVSAILAVALALTADAIAAALGVPAIGPAVRIFALVPPFAGTLMILIQASLAARVTRVSFLVRGLIEPLVLLVAGVIAWTVGAQLRGLAFAHVAAAVVTLAVGLRAMRGVFRPAERRAVLRAPHLPGFERFSLTMSAAEFLNVAFQRADLLILTAYLGAKGAAVYAAAEFITRVIANIRYAFDAIVAGVMAESLELGDHARLRYNLQLATRWVVTVAALIAGTVVVLRRELLGGLYGATYVAGTGAVVILAATHLVSASWGLVSWVLIAGGRSRLILLNNFLGASFNVGASFYLVPRYGLIGAAAASLGSMVVVLGSALVEVKTVEKISPFSASLWKPLVAATAAFVVESVARALVGPIGLRIAAVVASGLAVYLVILLAAGLPIEERRWAEKLRHRAALALGKGGPRVHD